MAILPPVPTVKKIRNLRFMQDSEQDNKVVALIAKDHLTTREKEELAERLNPNKPGWPAGMRRLQKAAINPREMSHLLAKAHHVPQHC